MEYFLTDLEYTFDYLQKGTKYTLQQLVKASSKESARGIVEAKAKEDQPSIIIWSIRVKDTLIEK